MFKKSAIRQSLVNQRAESSPENGDTDGSSVPAAGFSPFQPPAGDGSEEFFAQFTDREEGSCVPSTRTLLMGAGVVAGVIAGASIAYWLIREKRRKPWWQRLFGL